MIVVHPTLSDWRKDVPDADADRWLAAGWLPERPKPEPAPEPRKIPRSATTR